MRSLGTSEPRNGTIVISVFLVAAILAIGSVAIVALTAPPPQTHPCNLPSGRDDPRCVGWYAR